MDYMTGTAAIIAAIAATIKASADLIEAINKRKEKES